MADLQGLFDFSKPSAPTAQVPPAANPAPEPFTPFSYEPQTDTLTKPAPAEPTGPRIAARVEREAQWEQARLIKAQRSEAYKLQQRQYAARRQAIEEMTIHIQERKVRHRVEIAELNQQLIQRQNDQRQEITKALQELEEMKLLPVETWNV